MSMPGMYVSPEQLMSDRADYARKGIARGRSLVVLEYDSGIALVAENASATLRKISEIYDRIAFGGVGRYSEFDTLRIAGLRLAELTGYQYSRADVEARSLANQYAQLLGHTFTHEMKPMEVEIVVAELAPMGGGANSLYRVQYDGTVTDEYKFCCIGGESDAVFERVGQGYREDLSRDAAITLAVESLVAPGAGSVGSALSGARSVGSALSGAGSVGPDLSDAESVGPTLPVVELEVAVLEDGGDNTVFARRCFRRLSDAETARAVGRSDVDDEVGASGAASVSDIDGEVDSSDPSP